jgi:hypothetical protein
MVRAAPGRHAAGMTPSPAPALLPEMADAAPVVPPAPIVDAFSVVVDAPVADVRAALHRVDLLDGPSRALDALGAVLVLRPTTLAPAHAGGASFGVGWRVGDGHVTVRWDVDVRPDADERAVLSVAGAAAASDAETHARLLDAWCLVAPLCDTLRRRLARAVAAAAESD